MLRTGGFDFFWFGFDFFLGWKELIKWQGVATKATRQHITNGL